MSRALSLLHLYENQKAAAYEKLDVSPELFKKMCDYVAYRNITLCEEVNKYRKLGKKVFVIAGLRHLLLLGEGPLVDLTHTKKTLSQHKFVLLPPHSRVDKNKLLEHNPDLSRQRI